MRANTSGLCFCNVNTKRPFAFTQEATVNRPYAFICHSRTKTQVSRPCAFTINTKRPFAFTQEATVNRPYAFTCHSRTKTQISRPCAFRINQLCAFFTKRVDYFQSLSREARLITPIGKSLGQSQQLSK